MKEEITKSMKVRGLMLKNAEAVKQLDEGGGWNVAQWVEELEEDEVSDYAYGIFDNDLLVGYCTIGGADDVGDVIEKDVDYINGKSLLLSDVYVTPDYRGMGVATKLITEAIELRVCYYENIYCEPSHPDLFNLYRKAGFKKLNDYTLKRV